MGKITDKKNDFPWKETLGFLGVVIAVYLGYLGVRSQVGITIQATPEVNLIPEGTISPLSVDSNYSPDLIIGIWENEFVDFIIPRSYKVAITRDQSRENCYVGIQASLNSSTNYAGETIMEFCYDPLHNNFVGRHIWGGGKSSTTEWGKYGGLVMELKDANTLFVRFLDSIYSDGWIYTRVN